MEDFIYIMGEELMMNIEAIKSISYPENDDTTMVIKTENADYAVKVTEIVKQK